jgi:hypothetical protein
MMARIYVETDEDVLPNLADILKHKKSGTRTRTPTQRETTTIAAKEPPTLSRHYTQEHGLDGLCRSEKPSQPRQRSLKRVENNSVLLQSLKVSSGVNGLNKESKRRTPAQKAQNMNTKAEEEGTQHRESTNNSEITPDYDTSTREEDNTLDEIEFWSKPRPVKSPPQIRPPPESSRAARIKARSFRLPPQLKQGSEELQVVQPQESDSTVPASRILDTDDDFVAFLT